MPVSTLPSAKEFEEKGWAEFEFVGFRYIGPNSLKTDRDVPQRAGYGGSPKFQRGQTYLGILPTWLDDEHVANSNLGVHALEARSDFEVIYDPERLARALLSRNYLPSDVFYEGFDRWKRAKVLEKLDLDDAGRVFEKDDEEPYREQLRAIADVEPDEEAAVSQQRAEEYARRFPRSELSDVVKVLRQDPDEIDLRTAGQTDMAEYLTQFGPDVVELAIDVAHGDADADALAAALDEREDEDGDDDGETERPDEDDPDNSDGK